MVKTINNIEAVRVAEQHFDVETLKPGRTWVIELTESGILTYHTEYKSRKKLGESRTPVSKQEMKAFFKEMYDFARSADMCCETVDDCSHKVTFIYSPLHKEVCEGATLKGNDSLIGLIDGFVDAHR